MLNLRFLNYFMATAKHGSFARAAEQINISKSALIRAVDFLEEDCGTRL
ncbi:LysR family transcriptional regulator [Marinobacter orientalis]|uniref:LysR family transcriptional regulator n=1 Tax=Marinobacter orientalis TaxID=1928859 RepID=A0A7Y0REZ8_9GAMM|nr:LysR family transcriptional regulator [Marinobacter orientalis]NMT65008.1 LysR family transcriptional regulator [Marinobacter orientalis]TGX48101.1 LysR family transcriptional regulator [Marinobacter orientalis]